MTQRTIISVGMADMNTAEGSEILRTAGLGSCIGLTLYDALIQKSGMVHIMLPDSTIAKTADFNIAKFADTAIPALIERMVHSGASKHRLAAKMAGGAQMFTFTGHNDMMRIGQRNYHACRDILSKLKIPLIVEDCGGNHGRTIELYNDTGKLLVKSANFGIKEL